MTHSQDNGTERDNASGAGKEEPFDLREYAFFVPLQMWGHTFCEILNIRKPRELKNDDEECAAEPTQSNKGQPQQLGSDGEEGAAKKKKGNKPTWRLKTLNNFPIGPNRPKGDLRSDEEIAREMISRAMQAYHRPNDCRIPVMLFPVTLAQRFANPFGKEENRLKVLAPALKTRDDIFLFLYDGRAIDDNVAKLGYYGSKLTTTALGEIYNSLVIKEGADPLFGKPLSQGKGVMEREKAGLAWGYSLQFVPLEWPREKAVEDNADYHGLIAAGPELKHFWRGPKWEAAVNLNAWISRALKTRYFVRAVFCTPLEVYDEEDKIKREKNRKQIQRFWRKYCNRGIEWVLLAHKKCREAHPLWAKCQQLRDTFPTATCQVPATAGHL